MKARVILVSLILNLSVKNFSQNSTLFKDDREVTSSLMDKFSHKIEKPIVIHANIEYFQNEDSKPTSIESLLKTKAYPSFNLNFKYTAASLLKKNRRLFSYYKANHIFYFSKAIKALLISDFSGAYFHKLVGNIYKIFIPKCLEPFKEIGQFKEDKYAKNEVGLIFAIGLLMVIIIILIFMVLKMKNSRIQLERIVLSQANQIRDSINELKSTKRTLKFQIQKHKKIIGSITHDIKSPLIYLGYGIDFLKEELFKKNSNQEDVYENLNAIDESVKKLQQYTENILSFSKASLIESNNTDALENLNALILSKIELFKQMANIKGVQLTFEAKKQVILKINKNLVSVILHNLMDNAIKNTSKGYVRVDLKKIGKKIIIKVRDNGIGMDQQTLLKYRNLISGATETNVSESGLGLYIIAESIKIIGAKISVESTKGKGTEVVIIIDEEAH